MLEIISNRGWAAIRGNNEYYALDFGTCRAPKHWSSFTLPPYLREQLGNTWLNVMACQPDTLSLRFPDSPPIRVFHGIPDDPFVSINPLSKPRETDSWLKHVKEETIIAAHSHIAMERQMGSWQIFNPGSIGVPLDGDSSASYMILRGARHGWELEQHRRVPFDSATFLAEFERQQFVEQCGVTARLIIEEFLTARLRVHPWQAWKRRYHPDIQDSFELLEEFLALEDVSEFIPPEYRDLDSTLYRD